MKLRKIQSKRAAMEMSVGTIVTIVLLMSVLIFGLIFVRNIMCAGIEISNDVTSSVESEIVSLFGSGNYGVKCVGEGTDRVNIGANGETKSIGCIAVVDEQKIYDFNVQKIESISGASTETIKNWVVDSGLSDFEASPGTNNDAEYLHLRPPRDATSSTLKVTLEVEDKISGSKQTHIIVFDVTPVGTFTSAIC